MTPNPAFAERKPTLTPWIIVACTRERTIGRAGELPWRLSGDLQRFKRLTMGHVLVMGRKTWDSIGRPLPGRTTIVVTRDPGRLAPTLPAGVRVAGSLDEALRLAALLPEHAGKPAFVVGGGEIYRLALATADRVYCTWVEACVPGDATFPPFPDESWRVVEASAFPADEKNEYPTYFTLYERVRGAPPVILHQGESSMTSALSTELLALNQKLLDAIFGGDWKTYAELCAADITCFEPEARGECVAGHAFHKFYFDLPKKSGASVAPQVTMASPQVRMLGAEGAVLTYVRLVQSVDANGAPQTSRIEETRVWQKFPGGWKHVHFHRSVPT